jgi:hypothetical protein
MTHLTPEQFIDIAEGAAPEASAPHLAACDACRRELAGLRAMMSEAAAGSDVPEPPTLFWNRLSSRVHDAAVEQGGRPQSWFGWLTEPRVLVPALATALALLIAVVLLPRSPALPVRPLPPIAPLGAADDPALRVVAVAATGVAPDEMMDDVEISSDAVAAALTVDEQRELRRLLTQEMAQPSALEKRS